MMLPFHGIRSSLSSSLHDGADDVSLAAPLVDDVDDNDDFHHHISLKYLNLNLFNDHHHF